MQSKGARLKGYPPKKYKSIIDFLSFVLLLNKKEDNLKNFGNQTVGGSLWLP